MSLKIPYCTTVLATVLMTNPVAVASTILPDGLTDPLDDPSTRTIKFTNKSGGAADDLHVVFNQTTMVTSNPFMNDRESNGVFMNDTHNFWGMNIAANGTVTLAFSANKVDLTIKEWWWTKGGNAVGDGVQTGQKNADTNGTELSFLGPATGNGALLVQINGTNNTFTTTPGFTAAQEAAAFNVFLSGLQDNGFALINADMPDTNIVDFVGNLLGDPGTSLSISVLHQDSTQSFILAPFPPIPEPSTFLLLAVGIGLIGAAKSLSPLCSRIIASLKRQQTISI